MKQIIILLMILVMVPVVIGIQCQVSTDNATWANFSTSCYGGCIDETGRLAYIQNLNASTDYYVRCRNETSAWGYTSFTTDEAEGGESIMASLAIMVFALSIIGLCFALPFVMKTFSKNKILDNLLKRLCWMLGLFLLTLTSAIAASMSVAAELNIEDEIFVFMRIINWAIYLFMVYIVLNFCFDTIKLLQQNAKKHRFGPDKGGGNF